MHTVNCSEELHSQASALPRPPPSPSPTAIAIGQGIIRALTWLTELKPQGIPQRARSQRHLKISVFNMLLR